MNPEELLNQAILAYQNGQLDKAENILTDLTEQSPEFAGGFAILGIVLTTKGNIDKAYDVIQHALKLDPKNFSALVNLGNIHLMKGEPENARPVFLKVLEIQADFIPALINLGHINTDSGNIEKAWGYYEKALEIDPQNPEVLVAVGRHQLDKGLADKAYDHLIKAVTLAPANVHALTLLGNAAKDKGLSNESEIYYKKVLELDPGNQGALQNLRSLLSQTIPKWHFTMLADERRNEAYDQAIKKAVSNSSKVLDIGTGSGILSMMAARAGAEYVTGCEMHSKLADVARQVINDNGFNGKIRIIKKKSTDLIVGEDLPEPANVLISEILDAGAIGEGVVHVIRHAKAKLTTEDAKIIPSEVRLFGQLVEIPQRSRVAPVKNISGFDLSAFDIFRIPEAYTSVNLHSEDHTILSEEMSLIDYDFYHLPDAIQDNMPLVKEVTFPITRSGILQAIAFWFDLQLDDEIMVSSRPGGELAHWGQALFCFPNPKNVEAGTSETVKMIYSDQIIRFRL